MSAAFAISPPEPAFDERRLRDAFGRFATGVALVTTEVDGAPLGLIVSSFAAVSLDPPLVSFCPARDSLTWRRMRAARRFTVHVLSDRSADYVRRAAAPGADRFGDPDVLRDALAVIDCELEAEHPAGDHSIVVGRVRGLQTVRATASRSCTSPAVSGRSSLRRRWTSGCSARSRRAMTGNRSPSAAPSRARCSRCCSWHAGRTISSARLIDELWGDAAPASARKMVQINVSQLRKVLPEGVLRTHAGGYSLAIDPQALDLARFERLAREGRAAADPREAADKLAAALALWRGPALAEFDEPFAEREGTRLEALRLSALEDRIEADLALGRHAAVAPELDGLVRDHPERERMRGQHMLALYRSGRQTDALASYREAWRRLGEELGIMPSVELRKLEAAIFAHDPALDL